MAERLETSVTEELESRLDCFFNEDEGSLDFTKIEDESKAGYFEEIKSILLSIDWEITDEGMTHFIDLLSKMERAYRGDKNLHVFLQMIISIAKYIKVNKANAHPSVMKVLTSVYSGMERVNLDTDIAEEEKEKILLTEVRRFKNLKKKIAVSRVKRKIDPKGETPGENISSPKKKRTDMLLQTEGPPAGEEAGERPTDFEGGSMPPHEAFAYALEEIKALIRAEFRALRAELGL